MSRLPIILSYFIGPSIVIAISVWLALKISARRIARYIPPLPRAAQNYMHAVGKNGPKSDKDADMFIHRSESHTVLADRVRQPDECTDLISEIATDLYRSEGAD